MDETRDGAGAAGAANGARPGQLPGDGARPAHTPLANRIVDFIGEINLLHSESEARIRAYKHHLEEHKRTVRRLHVQLRQLENEADAHALFRPADGAPAAAEPATEFDPLELDRYSRLQQLARGLMESMGDLVSLQSGLGQLVAGSDSGLRTRASAHDGLTRVLAQHELGMSFEIASLLRVDAAGQRFALPLAEIVEVRRVAASSLAPNPCAPSVLEERYAAPCRHLAQLLDSATAPVRPVSGNLVPVVVLRAGERYLGLAVDGLAGIRRAAVKPLTPPLDSLPWLQGLASLGDDLPTLVLSPDGLADLGDDSAETIVEAAGGPADTSALVEPTIMVVDDSVTVRKVTERFLTRNGMQVLTARDGLEALGMLRDQRPDLVLLDVEMPRMDGFELATAIRADPHLADLPVVMITSRTGAKHEERARSIGVDDYLGKPYKEDELLRKIRTYLGTGV